MAQEVLRDINMSIEEGEFIAIMIFLDLGKRHY